MKWLLAAIAITACSAPVRPPPPPPKPPPPPAECGKQLAPFLDVLAKEGAGRARRREEATQMVAAPDALPELPPSARIEVTPTEVLVDGQLMLRWRDRPPSPLMIDVLRDMLAERVWQAANTTCAHLPIEIRADARTTWEQVLSVTLAASGNGCESIGYVFTAGRTRVPTPRSTLGERPTTLAIVWERVLGRCDAVRKVLAAADKEQTPAGADEVVRSRVPGALDECGCEPDLASVEHLLWWRWDRDTIPLETRVTITFDPRGAKVSARHDALWRDVAPRLLGAPRHRVRPNYSD